MDIRYMRSFVADQYPSTKWKEKVRHMPENQVVAIYYSMINRKNKQTTKVKKEEPYHQMNLEEYEPPKKKEPIEVAFEKGYTNDGPQIQLTQLNLFDFMEETV